MNHKVVHRIIAPFPPHLGCDLKVPITCLVIVTTHAHAHAHTHTHTRARTHTCMHTHTHTHTHTHSHTHTRARTNTHTHTCYGHVQGHMGPLVTEVFKFQNIDKDKNLYNYFAQKWDGRCPQPPWIICLWLIRKEMFYLTTHSTHFI